MIPATLYGETTGVRKPPIFVESKVGGEPYAEIGLKDPIQDFESGEYTFSTTKARREELKDWDIPSDQHTTAEDYPSPTPLDLPKTVSPPFAEFLLRKHAIAMLEKLVALRENLGKPDGVVLVAQFRDAISEAWKISASLEREKILLVSALEEIVRGKKWQELKSQHIILLEQLTGMLRQQTISQKELAKAFQLIQKSGMDIYPDASVDEDEGDE